MNDNNDSYAETAHHLQKLEPTMSNNPPLQVLLFDVFGTTLSWRDAVTRSLQEAATKALNESRESLSPDERKRASAMTYQDWLAIAEEWRGAYNHFTHNFDPSAGFVLVDQHHYESLCNILQRHSLGGIFTDGEKRELALSWHRLDAWPDTVQGLALLSSKFKTCTLSNGNVSLLEDLVRHASLPFTDIASAEHFGAYKPSPKVYLGAAGRFGMQPNQCAMVAAHLNDLKAAKALGFQTIYVERPREETQDPEQARREGYVDLWIGEDFAGFVEVAKQLGVPVTGEL